MNIKTHSALLLLVCVPALSQQRISPALVKVEHDDPALPPTTFQYHSYDERKSVTLAVVFSLVLPGMGELYAESFGSGKYYLLADAGLWTTYAGFQMHGHWLRQDARSFATQHAQASFDGKDDQFDVNIGNFLTSADYDQAKLRNREYDLRYSGTTYAWSWDSDVNRNSFRDLRIRSDQAFNSSKFVVAGLVINRILSAFSAGRAASSFNRNLRAEEDWRLRAYPDGGLLSADGVKVELTKSF